MLQVGSYHNFQLVDAPVPKPKATEVLVKTHAVSLQFRDLLIAKGTYSYECVGFLLFYFAIAQHFLSNSPIPNLVPGSDVAGVIVAVGDDVKEWKEGDRVCVNFTPDHLYGDADAKIHATSLGAVTQGVLTEYRTFPAYVCRFLFPPKLTLTIADLGRALSEFPTISLSRKRQHYRTFYSKKCTAHCN